MEDLIKQIKDIVANKNKMAYWKVDSIRRAIKKYEEDGHETCESKCRSVASKKTNETN